MKSYGVPYRGSKNTICTRLLEHIPSAPHLFDVFAGGCAMTHAALLCRRFPHVHANDIPGRSLRLFQMAKDGELYGVGQRWVSREEYNKLCGVDPFVTHAWSFSSKPSSYLYGADTVEFEEAKWRAVVKGDFTPLKRLLPEMCADVIPAMANAGEELLPRYRTWNKAVCAWLHGMGRNPKDKRGGLPLRERVWYGASAITTISNALRVLSIGESLKGVQSELTTSTVDYREVDIPPDAVIYADPPYAGTSFCTPQTKNFDSEAFYDWAESRQQLTLISEYAMPEERFVSVYGVNKANFGNGGRNVKAATEKLFVPRGQLDMYRDMMRGMGNLTFEE